MIRRFVVALALLGLLAQPAPAADVKPVVISPTTGQQQRIQSTDTLQVPASTTANASLNIPHGTAPTSPSNGDCWTTTAGLYCRINGSTVGPMGSGSSGGVAYQQVLTVAKSGGDYTAIQAAINSISDAASSKRYLIWIAPGVYTEQVTMQAWVDLRGANKHAVQLTHTGDNNGTIILASHVQVEDLEVEETNTASEWAIVGSDTSQVHIRNVDILGVIGGSQVSQGIKLTGNTFATVFIEHSVINYLGSTGWGIYLAGNSTVPQNADLHINDTFVDSFGATTGGSVYYQDLFAGRVRDGLYRTSSGGFDFKVVRTAGTVDLLLEGVTAEYGTPSVSIGSGASVLSKHSTLDTHSGSGTFTNFDGTVTSVVCGTGLSGGTITTTGTCALTAPVTVALGGTNATSASGTALDNISGFSGTGFLTRTGAGAYSFQSATNGITNGNLAQIGANTVIGNPTGSTANRQAMSMPSCSAASSALTWTTSSGFGCNTISGGGTGTVTTSGSPASGNLAKFSGSTAITNGDLTGDVTTSGSLLTTMPTVNSNVGTFGSSALVPVVTVNGKGLVTAVSTASITGTVPGSGGLIGVRVFTSGTAATYTPTSGTTFIIVELQAGGGGGAGVSSPGSGKSSLGGGGGGGGWLRVKLTANFSGGSYTVGAKGNGAVAGANNGSTGGNSTFTTTAGSPVTYTAAGGLGGVSLNALAPPLLSAGGASGGITGGTPDIYRAGLPGGPGASWSTFVSYGGRGGASVYSSGVPENILQNGSANTQAAGVSDAGGYGGGGSGAVAHGTGTAQAGGDGTPGVIIIWEFS